MKLESMKTFGDDESARSLEEALGLPSGIFKVWIVPSLIFQHALDENFASLADIHRPGQFYIPVGTEKSFRSD